MEDLELDQSLRRGVAWLVAAQDKDGGWHSETYGALRGGAAVTALVLESLAQLPAELRDQLADVSLDAGRFLQAGIDRRGGVACPDGTLDYPVYASAQILVAARRLPLGLSLERRLRVARYLLDAQLLAPQGFAPEDSHFGGWDLAGAAGGPRRSTGSNISLVRSAMEGVAAAYEDEELAGKLESGRRSLAIESALRWLNRCQAPTGDGGFVFAPEPSSLDNKAGWSDSERRAPRSYATATGDGLRGLVACRVPPDDSRRATATRWLADHWSVERVSGFADDDESRGWSDGLRYYHFASLGSCLNWVAAGGDVVERRQKLSQTVRSLQRADGSWRNASPRMREDDPLIATSLALQALARSHFRLSK